MITICYPPTINSDYFLSYSIYDLQSLTSRAKSHLICWGRLFNKCVIRCHMLVPSIVTHVPICGPYCMISEPWMPHTVYKHTTSMDYFISSLNPEMILPMSVFSCYPRGSLICRINNFQEISVCLKSRLDIGYIMYHVCFLCLKRRTP